MGMQSLSFFYFGQFSAFCFNLSGLSSCNRCPSSNFVVMSNHLSCRNGLAPDASADNSEASDEMSDECQDTPNFEPGTIVLLCDLPENLKASENTEATVIYIEKKCEKVMVQAVIHGVSQKLRLPIRMIKLPPLIRPPQHRPR